MNSIRKIGYALLMIGITFIAGCATKAVVVPADTHHKYVAEKYVVYHTRPAKRHCWRHRAHWHCR